MLVCVEKLLNKDTFLDFLFKACLEKILWWENVSNQNPEISIVMQTSEAYVLDSL